MLRILRVRDIFPVLSIHARLQYIWVSIYIIWVVLLTYLAY